MIFFHFTLIISVKEGEIMKAKVAKDKCIGCGNCVSLTDAEIFDFDKNGLAECLEKTIPEDKEEVTKEAIKYCPTGAIEEE